MNEDATPDRAANLYEIAFRAFWGGKEHPPGTVWPSEVWLRLAVDAILAEVGERVKDLTTHDGMLYPAEVFAVLRNDYRADVPYDAWLAGQGIDPDTGES